MFAVLIKRTLKSGLLSGVVIFLSQHLSRNVCPELIITGINIDFVPFLVHDDDDELMLNVLRCHLTY